MSGQVNLRTMFSSMLAPVLSSETTNIFQNLAYSVTNIFWQEHLYYDPITTAPVLFAGQKVQCRDQKDHDYTKYLHVLLRTVPFVNAANFADLGFICCAGYYLLNNPRVLLTNANVTSFLVPQEYMLLRDLYYDSGNDSYNRICDELLGSEVFPAGVDTAARAGALQNGHQFIVPFEVARYTYCLEVLDLISALSHELIYEFFLPQVRELIGGQDRLNYFADPGFLGMTQHIADIRMRNEIVHLDDDTRDDELAKLDTTDGLFRLQMYIETQTALVPATVTNEWNFTLLNLNRVYNIIYYFFQPNVTLDPTSAYYEPLLGLQKNNTAIPNATTLALPNVDAPYPVANAWKTVGGQTTLYYPTHMSMTMPGGQFIHPYESIHEISSLKFIDRFGGRNATQMVGTGSSGGFGSPLGYIPFTSFAAFPREQNAMTGFYDMNTVSQKTVNFYWRYPSGTKTCYVLVGVNAPQALWQCTALAIGPAFNNAANGVQNNVFV